MNPGDLVRDKHGHLLKVVSIQSGRNNLIVRSVATNDRYEVSFWEVTPEQQPITRKRNA